MSFYKQEKVDFSKPDEVYSRLKKLNHKNISENDCLLKFRNLEIFERSLNFRASICFVNDEWKSLAIWAKTCNKAKNKAILDNIFRVIQKVDSHKPAVLIALCLSRELGADGMDYLIERIKKATDSRSIVEKSEKDNPEYHNMDTLTDLLIANRMRLDSDTRNYMENLINPVWGLIFPILKEEYINNDDCESPKFNITNETANTLYTIAEKACLSFIELTKDVTRLPNALVKILRLIASNSTDDKILTLIFNFYKKIYRQAIDDYSEAFFHKEDISLFRELISERYDLSDPSDHDDIKGDLVSIIHDYCIKILINLPLRLLQNHFFSKEKYDMLLWYPHEFSEFENNLFDKLSKSSAITDGLANFYTKLADPHTKEFDHLEIGSYGIYNYTRRLKESNVWPTEKKQPEERWKLHLEKANSFYTKGEEEYRIKQYAAASMFFQLAKDSYEIVDNEKEKLENQEDKQKVTNRLHKLKEGEYAPTDHVIKM